MSQPEPVGAEVKCQAWRCKNVALTAWTDGAGRHLELCEEHGDLLAVGFRLERLAQRDADR